MKRNLIRNDPSLGIFFLLKCRKINVREKKWKESSSHIDLYLIFLSRDFAWNGKLNKEKPYEIFFARFSGFPDFVFVIVCLINIIIQNIMGENSPKPLTMNPQTIFLHCKNKFQ
jgi:hypothetical protein